VTTTWWSRLPKWWRGCCTQATTTFTLPTPTRTIGSPRRPLFSNSSVWWQTVQTYIQDIQANDPTHLTHLRNHWPVFHLATGCQQKVQHWPAC
jgi:hypothetical protein